MKNTSPLFDKIQNSKECCVEENVICVLIYYLILKSIKCEKGCVCVCLSFSLFFHLNDKIHVEGHTYENNTRQILVITFSHFSDKRKKNYEERKKTTISMYFVSETIIFFF